MIKAILFDLDGTLADSETYYVNGTIKWLSKKGVNIDFKTASGIIGLNMDETYEYISKISGFSKEEIKKVNEDFFSKEDPLKYNEVLFNDVIKCFEELKKQNIKICICSMSPRLYVERFIKECNLNEYIDMYISDDDCRKPKPSPEIYIKAINYLGITPKEAVVVEDAPNGIKAGIGSGAYVIARNGAKFGLNQEGALCILEDLSELFTIIMEINNGKYD